MRKRHVLAGLAGLAFVAACITVNIYFPEATVKKTAEEIVDEIRQKEAEKKEPKTPGGTVSVIPARRSFSFAAPAYAQEATTVSTPSIRALKKSMKDRFPALKPYFDGGNLGETNKGMVDIRGEAGLDLKSKAALRNLVKDENGDRSQLYAEVAKALNIEAGQIERIQKIFAQSWIKSAAAGWWVQDDEGKWIKKT
jgi:uncharacterized protein YdbL (DUF1318 family)